MAPNTIAVAPNKLDLMFAAFLVHRPVVPDGMRLSHLCGELRQQVHLALGAFHQLVSGEYLFLKQELLRAENEAETALIGPIHCDRGFMCHSTRFGQVLNGHGNPPLSASIDIMARALAQTLSCIKLQIDDQIAANHAATFEITQAASRFDANTSVRRQAEFDACQRAKLSAA
jgi:hypothetical protein